MASTRKPAAGKAKRAVKPGAGKGKSAGEAVPKKPGVVRETASHAGARTRKTYNLSHDLIMEAKRLLGAKTATAAIEESLRMAVFSQRIAAGAKRSLGRSWEDPFGEDHPLEPNAPVS